MSTISTHTSYTQKLRHDVVRRGVRVPVRRAAGLRPAARRTPYVAPLYNLVRAGGLTVLLFALVGLGLGDTLSFYQDVERSTGNTLATGGVDFILEDNPFAALASSSDWAVDVIPEDFSNPFFYYASTTNFSGNLDLCAALTVTITVGSTTVYTGPLTELRSATTTDLLTWKYDFDGFENFPGQTCHFDIDYNGWQTRHGYNPGGYSDTETVSYWLTVPSLLLTKVYFDYDAGEACTDSHATTTITSGAVRFALTNNHLPDCDDVSPTQEWVEVYNLTEEPISLTGWQLCDGEVCDTLFAADEIGPGEFGLIAGNPSIHTEISIPWGVVLSLVPDGQIGNGLRTLGDMLQLRSPEGQTVDQLNWGTVDPFWPHYNAMLWGSGELTATSGAALARLPIDVDTNQPEDWQLLGIPAVTLLSPSSTTVAVTPGEITNIEWLATNLNGPDEDLKIDIYWFDPSDGLHLIVLNTENDGLYEWLVPEMPYENVRVKLVATGPENPLLNTRILTEPIPSGEAESGGGVSATLAPTSPSAPSTPTEPAAPTFPSTTTAPIEVSTTTKPTAPLTVASTTEPATTSLPSAPATTTLPAIPTTPASTTPPESAAEPGKPTEPIEPTVPTAPLEPEAPEEPIAPEPPTAPATTESASSSGEEV